MDCSLETLVEHVMLKQESQAFFKEFHYKLLSFAPCFNT